MVQPVADRVAAVQNLENQCDAEESCRAVPSFVVGDLGLDQPDNQLFVKLINLPEYFVTRQQ